MSIRPALAARSIILLALAILSIQEIGGDPAPKPAAAQPPRPVPVPSPTVTGPPSVMDALAGPAAPADLDVMTFNLRFASTRTPNAWTARRPVMRTLLRTERPDLIGTQEGLSGQLHDIETDLGADYDFIGVGREVGYRGEHTAIFFDKTRLFPVTSGNFWLSTRPQTPGSKSWGTAHPRMVTWVLFADLETGRHFYAVNTHLDNQSENARRHGAQLIAAKLATFAPLPIVLTGDFNSAAKPSSHVYQTLVPGAGLNDAWLTAGVRSPAYATIHNWQPLIPNGERDDWILTTPGITARAILMDTYRRGTQYPSDHLPIESRLQLP